MGKKSINVNVELKLDSDGKYKAYISDDIGGREITVRDETADGISQKIKKQMEKYIDDLYYLYEPYL